MEDGEATGLEQLAQLNPVDGDHEYVIPPEEVRFADEPEIIIALVPATAVGPLEFTTEVVKVCVQPFASVTVTE